jgi:hypothetical protein
MPATNEHGSDSGPLIDASIGQVVSPSSTARCTCSTTMREAISPAAAPPIPSATMKRPRCSTAAKASLFARRTRPRSVSPYEGRDCEQDRGAGPDHTDNPVRRVQEPGRAPDAPRDVRRSMRALHEPHGRTQREEEDAPEQAAARSYGLYFGMRNAPSRVQIHAPKLDIEIVPPKGIRDPDFVEAYGDENYVDGFHTKQVARITVHAPGRYHVRVASPEESGGSFSIGELPTEMDSDHALARAKPVGIVAIVLSALLVVGAVVVRRMTARSNVASPT